MEMAMAQNEQAAPQAQSQPPPNGYVGGPTSTPQAPNSLPNNQTPGHPSFRRYVAAAGVRKGWKNATDAQDVKGNVHRELARYESIPIPF